MNHDSIEQKITLFKEQNKENMTFTQKQKHKSMNIYCKSMWHLLLPLRDKFRNARLHIGKCQSHIIFTTKSIRFRFMLTKIHCNKQNEYLKGFLSNKMAHYNMVTLER